MVYLQISALNVSTLTDLEAEVGHVDEEERPLSLPVGVLLVGDLQPLVLQLAREGRQVDPPVDGTSPE